ncbi:condensation domain-containing protein, partial [Methylobacterium phyllosphaerae]
SYAQRRLWFLYRLEGPSPTYNIPLALRFKGRLEADALEAALADVAGRHESLRTVFPSVEDTPRQEILAAETARPVLACIETSEAELPRRLSEAAGYCFDLDREMPFRAWLFRLDDEQQVLLLLCHHIASDGWSMAPLVRDLGTAYAARCRGEVPGWRPLAVQYADYTLWQRELLGDEADEHSLIARQLAYWGEVLSGLPEQLDLPADRPRPAVASYRGGRVPLRLEGELHGRLLRLARDGQASLFMVMQAGLAALLTRLGAGEDIPFGSPIAGRTDDALDDLVGFFVNTLVLRTDTSGNPSFDELLGRVRTRDLEAYGHQDLPFERLVEMLNPPRQFGRHPLFQVMLVLQNNARASLQLAGLEATPQGVGSERALFDLHVSLSERRGSDGSAQGIVGWIEYASDLFERETAERLAASYVRFLEGIALDPTRRIGDIGLLSDRERHQILEEWNATAQ